MSFEIKPSKDGLKGETAEVFNKGEGAAQPKTPSQKAEHTNAVNPKLSEHDGTNTHSPDKKGLNEESVNPAANPEAPLGAGNLEYGAVKGGLTSREDSQEGQRFKQSNKEENKRDFERDMAEKYN